MESKQGIHVMTLANSIIGVSILAMPYCFKQCGIVLSIILLIFSSILSRLACHFLLKSAIKARLRTFEFLAYHIFGSLGKLFVEIGMIGFLIGTCIAFFVVMGDLGPQIVAHMTDTESTDTLRTTILVALAIFCVLPLGLLKNVDSLSGVCTATIGFYGCLVLKIMGESAPHILVGDWIDTVNFWRPAGILQCIPIFSMALFCQTQLFEIYQAIPNASLDKMNNLVRLAVNICTSVYIFVGIFGYIAISHEVNFTGNILMNFKPSIMTEVMKIGFVLSVAFSFPLVIFPCRASLYSLLYKPTYSALHESTSFYIPEGKFKILTFLIVLVSLIIGVMIPNIELVLGLVGSTIGVMICVLFPATCFICLTSKNTNERILAQIMLFIGIIMMVLGTYANLYAMEEVSHGVVTEKPIMIMNIDLKGTEEKVSITTVNVLIQKAIEDPNKEIRHEPPQPEAPPDETQAVIKEIKIDPIIQSNPIELQNIPPKAEPVENDKNVQDQPNPIDLNENKHPPVKEKIEIKPEKSDDLIEPVLKDLDTNKEKPKVPNLKADEIDKEAIKKEDKELEQVNLDLANQQQLYKEQHQLIVEHKKILDQLKLTNEKTLKDREEVKNEKLKAVKNIENLARLAIERLVDDKPKIEKHFNQSNIGLNSDQNLLNQGSEVLKKLAPIPLALAANLNQLTDKPLDKAPINQLANTQSTINEESTNINEVNNNKKVEEKENAQGRIISQDSINVLSLLKGEGIREQPKIKDNNTKPNVIINKILNSTVVIPLVEKVTNSSKNVIKDNVEKLALNTNESKKNLTEKLNLLVLPPAGKIKPEIVDDKLIKNLGKEVNGDKVASNHRDILSADNYLRKKRDVDTNETNVAPKEGEMEKSITGINDKKAFGTQTGGISENQGYNLTKITEEHRNGNELQVENLDSKKAFQENLPNDIEGEIGKENKYGPIGLLESKDEEHCRKDVKSNIQLTAQIKPEEV